MDIIQGMTNQTTKKDSSVIKKYKQETVIKGLGKTALSRMLTEFYFSNFFSNSVSIKPLKMDLNKGEVEFDFYKSIPLSVFLNDKQYIPKEILNKISEILMIVGSNKLETDKQTLKSYCNTFENFISKSVDILEEYDVSSDKLLKYNADICSVYSNFFDCQTEVITHGDFWLSNLLFNKEDDEIKLIDWEFADAGSIYLDLGTYYCYSLGFRNGIDLFLENSKLNSHSVHLIRFFAFFRILRILSFVSLEDVKKTKISDEYGLVYLINILKIFLEEIDSFVLDSGKEISEGIDSKTKVVVFAVSKDKKVLLLKRTKNDRFPNMWEPPGGRKEVGENLLDAVKRELHEETHLSVDGELTYLGETNFSISGANKKVNAVFFTIQIDEQEIKLTEHEKYGWFTVEEAIDLVEFDFIKLLLEKIKND